MLYMCVLQSRNNGDGFDLTLTLCKYDLSRGDLFVLSWARVHLFRSASVCWRWAQYFVIVSCD